MIKACVIGWPISHSRSPIIHGYWLKKYGMDGSYFRRPVEPENLSSFIASLAEQGFAGCNVTIPYKEHVFELVTIADETTYRLRAVNTVYRSDGQTFGTNTDGEGFLNSLKTAAPDFDGWNSRAVVLGAGGAAVAIVNALLGAGVSEIVVVNRSLERAQQLQARFGKQISPADWNDRADVLSDASLLVNTTSLGMDGQPDLEIGLHNLPSTALVTDIVYTPLRTKLLERAAERGHVVVEGLGMLLHQAVRGFELWFGVRPIVTQELHDLVVADLVAKSKP